MRQRKGLFAPDRQIVRNTTGKCSTRDALYICNRTDQMGTPNVGTCSCQLLALGVDALSNPDCEERIHKEVITVVAVENVLSVERLKGFLDGRCRSKTILFAASV